MGFSRQEHWSGLPFPSPMHQSEKWKGSHSVVSDSSRPHGLQPTRLLCQWDFPGKSTGVGCHHLLRWMSLPVCKNGTDENSAFTRLSHCASSVVKREQLKGHHTIYKPAGRSHPDFALPNPFWAMIRQVLIDDILCAEARIRISFGICIRLLGIYIPWGWTPGPSPMLCYCFLTTIFASAFPHSSSY